MALYERVSRCVHIGARWTNVIKSTIGVKQKFPLSSTLFGLYIDKLEIVIKSLGGMRCSLAGSLIHVPLFFHDVVLLSSSIARIQHTWMHSIPFAMHMIGR